jgi:hypothetical protein
MRKSAIGIDVPAGFCASQLVACASCRTSGTKTCQAPLLSTYRNGFSLITGDFGTDVTGGAGKVVAGALAVPTKTMFQLEPTQLPSDELRVTHCCWVPELIWPVSRQSAMKPPLDQLPSDSFRSPSR